jgi:hypothetical protein
MLPRESEGAMAKQRRFHAMMERVLTWCNEYVVEPETYKRDRLGIDAPTDEAREHTQTLFNNLVGAGLLGITIGFTLLATSRGTAQEPYVEAAFWALCCLGVGCLIAAHRVSRRDMW